VAVPPLSASMQAARSATVIVAIACFQACSAVAMARAMAHGVAHLRGRGEGAALTDFGAAERRGVAVDRGHDVEDADIAGGPGERVAAHLAWDRASDSCPGQSLEVLGQVSGRHVVQFGQPGGGYGRAGLAE
jgi:hypothetical protein